jgi:hypothetical protein
MIDTGEKPRSPADGHLRCVEDPPHSLKVSRVLVLPVQIKDTVRPHVAPNHVKAIEFHAAQSAR